MFEDRAYQIEAAEHGINAPGRPILCAPTGSGKTYIAALIAKHALEEGRTFGILTPRELLLNQVEETMQQVCGPANVCVLQSGRNWIRYRPIHVMSSPTLLSRTARNDAWFEDVDYLCIDECHLALSPKMAERILPHYKDKSKVIGLTATPARRGGKGLGDYFTQIKHVTSVRQLIKEGMLAPCEYWGGRLADITRIKTTAGDFDTKELSTANMPLVGDVIDNWLRLASDRHTIVFAVDVPHCEALADRFQAAGVSAAPLHIHVSREKRSDIVNKFKRREIQVLVNVTIASYGFDAPSVDCIVLARPTKSIVLHLQMIGRGMRTNEGKDFCMVLDHADNIRRLGQADDLFRWRLDRRKSASANWTRDPDNKKKEEGEEKVRECDLCNHMFSKSLVCPMCGWEVPIPKRDIDATDDNLVCIGRKRKEKQPDDWPDDKTFYRMLLGYARRKSYQPSWVYWTYKDRMDRPPMRGWEMLDPLDPSVRVRNWISARLRKYARDRKKREATA